MRYFRLAYKDNMTSTAHVEDVRADSKEDAIAKACGCGYPLTQVREISLAERVSAIEGHIDMADFDRKMFINSGMMSEERAQKNYDNVVAMYSKELAEVKEVMNV